jgi:hypothetical protein
MQAGATQNLDSSKRPPGMQTYRREFSKEGEGRWGSESWRNLPMRGDAKYGMLEKEKVPRK